MSQVRSASSIFVDSGAFSLYTRKVLLDKNKDFFTLKKGSEFREYCDRYGKFMQAMKDRVLLANVDVIYNPEMTWETQQFFEREYGVYPIPVVHYKTSMVYVDRYLQAATINKSGSVEPTYDMIAVGGFAWGGEGTTNWLDKFFVHVCPKSNKYLPLIKVHGFALTSWAAITRWPWWSVDSTTWFTTAAYGGIYMPKWSVYSQTWRYDKPPHILQVSDRSTSKSDKGRHFESLAEMEKGIIKEWLGSLGSSLQEVSGKGNKTGRGNDPSYIARSYVNLSYFKNLEENQPEWPYPLDWSVIQSVARGVGFGL